MSNSDASADADRAVVNGATSVPAVPASIPSADEIGKQAAQTLDVKDFEPFVREVCDGIYERLLDTVQDYLIENSDLNISGRISYAENRAARLQSELNGVDSALGFAIWEGTRPERIEKLKASEAKYSELIYSVGNAHEGETRHETALRYIRQAETSHGPAKADGNPKGGDEGSVHDSGGPKDLPDPDSEEQSNG